MPLYPDESRRRPGTTASTSAGPAAHAADEAFLRLARERFNIVFEAESVLRQEQLKDKRFRAGDQWETRDKQRRVADNRPALTVNRIPQFVKQVTGAQRSNPQDIQINPVDDDSDPETAEVLTGIVKHIEAVSHAQVAYDTAVEDQVVMGRGYMRIVTDYCDDQTDDQDIYIRRVRNPHTVYYDPRCQEPDYSDAMYAFVVCDYPEEEFKAKWGHKVDMELLDEDAFDAIGDQRQLWHIDGHSIRVAEYFYVEYQDIEIVTLSDGTRMPAADAEQAIAESLQQAQAAVAQLEAAAQMGQPVNFAAMPAMLEEVSRSTRKKRVVKWAKINGLQVIERGEWAGKWIPIIPVLGDEIDLDGRVDLRGIVRDARDQQRLYNFMVSSLVETIGLAPRAPWVIAARQLEGYEKYWKTAHSKSWAFLPYKHLAENGTFAPPPQRQTFEPAIQAISEAIALCDNNMKATTGFYDASLGERGPEQSGKAILARQKQGEIGSVHYSSNLARAKWALGRQLLDLIPKVYDVPRVLRIIGSDDQQRTVMVHAGNSDVVPDALPRGVKKVFDLSAGRYDIVIGQGPGRETQRQEAVEMMTAAIQANPELMQIIGDLYFGAMDWPRARQISERLKKMIPQAQDNADPDNPDALKAMVQQLQQQLQVREEMLKQATHDLAIQKVQADAKQALETLRLETQVAIKDAELQHKRDSEHRQLAASADAQTRELDARREERQETRGAAVSDTLLDAQMQHLQIKEGQAEASRARTDASADAAAQRDHTAAMGDADRQFQAQQAAQQAAPPNQPGAGA